MREDKTRSVYEKLDALNITLPELTPPVAAFVPADQQGEAQYCDCQIQGYHAHRPGRQRERKRTRCRVHRNSRACQRFESSKVSHDITPMSNRTERCPLHEM